VGSFNNYNLITNINVYLYKVPNDYVVKVLNQVIKPIKERTGAAEISEEEFLKIFEGKIGPSSVVKRIFTVVDSQHTSTLDPKEFFYFISLLDHGKPQDILHCKIYFSLLFLLLL
jgi:hypothetical protein